MSGEARWDRWWIGEGTIARVPFFVVGTLLLLVKHGLDAAVAHFAFSRTWQPFYYFILPENSLSFLRMSSDDSLFFGVLLALAQPFIAVGVLLTMARLRSAGLSRGLVFLFFVPVVNLFLFVLLCVLPPRPEDVEAQREMDEAPDQVAAMRGPYREVAEGYRRWRRLHAVHRRITNETTAGSAAVALALCVPATLGAVFLGTFVLRNYGWGLFVGGPFCLGLGSVVLFGLTRAAALRRLHEIGHVGDDSGRSRRAGFRDGRGDLSYHGRADRLLPRVHGRTGWIRRAVPPLERAG